LLLFRCFLRLLLLLLHGRDLREWHRCGWFEHAVKHLSPCGPFINFVHDDAQILLRSCCRDRTTFEQQVEGPANATGRRGKIRTTEAIEAARHTGQHAHARTVLRVHLHPLWHHHQPALALLLTGGHQGEAARVQMRSCAAEQLAYGGGGR
jgi:hypothetical protein